MFFVFLVAQSDGQIIVLVADVFGIDDNALSLQIDNLALFQRAGNQFWLRAVTLAPSASLTFSCLSAVPILPSAASRTRSPPIMLV